MPRRLVSLAALVLAVASSAGCADDVAPAATVGDVTEISNDDLMAEVAAWAESPGMLAALQISEPAGAAEGSYATAFVDNVLTFRLTFELHNAQFEELDLELSDQQLDEVRSGLFGDAATSAEVLDELGQRVGDRLVEDAARRFAVTEAMGEEGYGQWLSEAYTSTEIEVNPRYGSWDRVSGSVVPPEGPRPAPSADPFAEL